MIRHTILKGLRKLYTKIIGIGNDPHIAPSEVKIDAQQTSDKIYSMLISENPCMIARYGSTELECINNYLGIHKKDHSLIKYIQDKELDWWWNTNVMDQMQRWSGFFPPTEDALEKFSKQMLEDTKQMDILCKWVRNEEYLSEYYKNAECTHLMFIEPFWCENPWTRALKGKRVLVVHPFAEQIEKQYKENRTKLFSNPYVLPEFHLETIKAVQSLGGYSNGFKDWFEALAWMENEIDSRNYDICLIGCGSYGFPLAAHVKRTGHKAIHIGGALQLLFGIKGRRWANPMYGVKEWNLPKGKYIELFNEYWQYPDEQYKPQNAQQVENACYW